MVDPAGELFGELLGVHRGGQDAARRRQEPAAEQAGGVGAHGVSRDEVGIEPARHLVEVEQRLAEHRHFA